jgi:hypothetical protein
MCPTLNAKSNWDLYDDEPEDLTQVWRDPEDCTYDTAEDDNNINDTSPAQHTFTSGQADIAKEGKRLLLQLQQVIPNNELKKLLKNGSMEGERALRLAHQVDDILRTRHEQQGRANSKKKKTITTPKMRKRKVGKHTKNTSVQNLQSGTNKEKSVRCEKKDSAEDCKAEAFQDNEEYYQWKGKWYRWDTGNVETNKFEPESKWEGEQVQAAKEQKRGRVNSRLRNWIVAMRRNMKEDAKAAALQPFTISRDKMDQVYPPIHEGPPPLCAQPN